MQHPTLLRIVLFSLGTVWGAACTMEDSGLNTSPETRRTDAAVVDARPDTRPAVDAAWAASLCLLTQGDISESKCCAESSDFPSTCLVGACTCLPTASKRTRTCTCPNGCFDPVFGCVGPAATCIVGMDQMCNESPLLSSLRGRCVLGGRCVCATGKGLAPSGKCL